MSSAELKAQGNALFTAKKFEKADKKYTEAIQKVGDEAANDPKTLAVLYANRAACRLALKRYLDANNDAKKATQLDPTYAKAFARLASAQDALGEYRESKESWQRALDALPKSNLSPAEEIQKDQYQAGLNTAAANVVKMEKPITGDRLIIMKGGGRMPWELAAAIVPRLRSEWPVNLYSSAWVIHYAYEEFISGINKMKQFQINPVTNEMRGMPGAIVDLTNGILRDVRVMHITDNEFISNYNKQVVIREALARQRDEGWDSVRASISLTIRGWIMRAVMEAGLRQRHDIAVEFLKRCLDVVRTLRERWILVPKADRGAVLQQTFLFGIQDRYIESVMQTYALNPSPDLLEELENESDLLIREVDEALRQPRSQEPVDPGFVSSFYIYPRASAYSMKGFCYNKKASINPKDGMEFCRKAALAYIQAADGFPQDDEHHPWFLNIALGNMFQARTFPLRETLDVMKRIRLSIPKAKEIWERSSLSAAGSWGILEAVSKQEDDLRSLLAQGTFTLDSHPMIIPINFPVPFTSAAKLPPPLAKISHDELVLIELQGALEVECTSDSARDGRLVGQLTIDDAGKKPTLTIGHHLLEGKIALLPKPLAVLRRVSTADPDAMDCDGEDGDASQAGEASAVAWDAIAIVKRKIVFSKRPMPIVGRVLL
ncbi:hypothetical protein DFH09DRAFT_1367685 [Mycena vulgaris]|nr:hypothetical protein DFH09DRAFT_1367685 [Mycena vulgaris]